jgi:hypothetical protein
MFFKQKKLFNSGRYEIGDSEMGFWNVLSVENLELGQVFIRIRRSKPLMPDIEQYKTAVEVKWDYSSESTEMPTEKITDTMDEFETAIEELCWYNNLSFNIRSHTGLGERVWLFYTKSYDEFIELFNQRLTKLQHLPLTITHSDDPEWLLWKEGLDDYIE